MIQRYTNELERQQTVRALMRVDFMREKITRDECARWFANNELRSQRHVEIREVLVMLRDTWTDAFRTCVVSTTNSVDAFNALRDTVTGTISYATEAFQALALTWKCAVPQFAIRHDVVSIIDVGRVHIA